jgi:transient receptor potential cation channel subfamily V protein 5
MGNVTSDLTYNIKAQAEALSDGPPIYKLVGVAGDGELVRLMKIAIRTKNFNEIDRLIRTTVVKFLYNEGRCENITIEKLIMFRSNDRDKLLKLQTSSSKAVNLVKVAEMKRSYNTREVCFDMNQRGSVGETLLHLCLLNGSYSHNELAKRLLKHFPKMVNDIYVSDEFYGKA